MNPRSTSGPRPTTNLSKTIISGQPRATPSWTREQIREARKVNLELLLEARGHLMIEQGGGNCRVPDFPGLIVKESYWRWPERNLSGNAIDFHVQILRWTFHDTMAALTKS